MQVKEQEARRNAIQKRREIQQNLAKAAKADARDAEMERLGTKYGPGGATAEGAATFEKKEKKEKDKKLSRGQKGEAAREKAAGAGGGRRGQRRGCGCGRGRGRRRGRRQRRWCQRRRRWRGREPKVRYSGAKLAKRAARGRGSCEGQGGGARTEPRAGPRAKAAPRRRSARGQAATAPALWTSIWAPTLAG